MADYDFNVTTLHMEAEESCFDWNDMEMEMNDTYFNPWDSEKWHPVKADYEQPMRSFYFPKPMGVSKLRISDGGAMIPQACSDQFFLHGGRCYTGMCPPGFKAIDNPKGGMQCEACSNGCLMCDQPLDALNPDSCNSGGCDVTNGFQQATDNNVGNCNKDFDCPAPGFYDPTVGDCRTCDVQNCDACDGLGMCSMCKEDFYLYVIEPVNQSDPPAYECLGSCPSGTYGERGHCYDCHSDCQSCIGPENDACTSCAYSSSGGPSSLLNEDMIIHQIHQQYMFEEESWMMESGNSTDTFTSSHNFDTLQNYTEEVYGSCVPDCSTVVLEDYPWTKLHSEMYYRPEDASTGTTMFDANTCQANPMNCLEVTDGVCTLCEAGFNWNYETKRCSEFNNIEGCLFLNSDDPTKCFLCEEWMVATPDGICDYQQCDMGQYYS